MQHYGDALWKNIVNGFAYYIKKYWSWRTYEE